MKNFKEEIEAMKAQIAALENNLTCGCDIGCDDQVVLTRGEVIEEPKTAIMFTKEELITFATKLMERTVTACKEAVNNIELEPDYICDLSLNCNNQIEIEIDNSAIVGAVESEIDDVVELDNDSVEVEVDSIIDDMLYEKQS